MWFSLSRSSSPSHKGPDRPPRLSAIFVLLSFGDVSQELSPSSRHTHSVHPMGTKNATAQTCKRKTTANVNLAPSLIPSLSALSLCFFSLSLLSPSPCPPLSLDRPSFPSPSPSLNHYHIHIHTHVRAYVPTYIPTYIDMYISS